MKNMSCKLVVSVTLFFSFLAIGPLAHAQNSSEKEVIVVYKNKAGKETILDSDADVEQQYKHLPAVAVTADQETVKELKQDPDILYVENNVSFTAADSTDFKVLSDGTDTSDNFEQWNLEPIQVKQAWKAGLTGKNIKIAVIDSGISPTMTCRLPAGIQLSVIPLLTKMITATEHMSQGLSEPSITATELTASHRKHKYTRLKRLIRTARGIFKVFSKELTGRSQTGWTSSI
ncbi:Minor extracellular protease Epr [Bacillus subtilis subsp. subtilis]|nr:Minor extracellular protease Epr [Bacillus subtilis subsp. subtilis]